MSVKRIYSCGECPVCAGSGAVLYFRECRTNAPIFCCLLCGLAWDTPPGNALDEIVAISEAAPCGVRHLTDAEVSSADYPLHDVTETWELFATEIIRC